MSLKHFSIPTPGNIHAAFPDYRLTSRIIVVAIVGKTSNQQIPKHDYPHLMNSFDELLSILGVQKDSSLQKFQFDCFFDSEDNVVYVSLLTPNDNAAEAMANVDSVKQHIQEKGFLDYWSHSQNLFARALLFLFSISHIVLYTCPGYSLNVKTIQMLKVLSFVRARYQTAVSKVLAKCREVSEEWSYHGRLCAPRLIFVFKDCPYDISNEKIKQDRILKFKKMEHSLEDQIYMTLRKSRLVKDVCNRSLFSIAPNDEFVFVGLCTETKLKNKTNFRDYSNLPCVLRPDIVDEINDDEEVLTSLLTAFPKISRAVTPDFLKSESSGFADSDLSQLSFISSITSLSEASGYHSAVDEEEKRVESEVVQETFNLSQFSIEDEACALPVYDTSMDDFMPERFYEDGAVIYPSSNSVLNYGVVQNASEESSDSSECSDFELEMLEQKRPSHHLKDLLMKHVRKAHTEGFSDNMGKFSHVKSFFEVPSLQAWLSAVNVILNNQDSGIKEKNNVSIALEKLLGTELKFSHSRCKKVLPLALAVYQENLPPYYNLITHEKHVKRALAAFSHHARGPAQNKYLDELKEECDRLWENGRQTCDVLSLNKNPCTKPKHGSPSSSGALSAGESDHWSGVQFYSTCNCGAKQGPRQDPFSLRAANYDFYQIIGQECGCIHAECYKFPVFQPSISDYREADLNHHHQKAGVGQDTQLHDGHLGSPTLSTGKVWNVQDAHESEAALSIPLSTNYYDQANHLAMNYYTNANQEKLLVRQASTTEYLPGMTHLDSPVGLLPQFPSWSLLCKGPSSLYSHNLGLNDCPGFIPGSSYLLPWDVAFRETDFCKPEPTETQKKQTSKGGVRILKSGHRRNQRPLKELTSVKIFVGMEYECVRGHRFMSSAPGIVLKAGPNNVKEDATRITEGNMPLYLTCPCGKTVAQLIRVHIVTPKAPVFVTIEPKVRPSPPPCPTFITGERKPIPLSQSAYWVLRLPYVYASERKCYSIPPRIKNLKYGELLGPMFGITQDV